MKQFCFLLFVCLGVHTFAQSPSCCEDPKNITKTGDLAVASFASFGDDPAFRKMHPNPKPLKAGEMAGEMITFEAREGEEAQAYYVKGNAESKQYLFVIHEWWGLNEHIKNEADRLHEELGGDIHVIALDMYDGMVATTRDKASQLMQSVEAERARAIIVGAQMLAGEEAQICTIGWCFGGGWSLQATLEVGEQAAGCVMYYGMPEEDVDRLATLNADVLGIFASEDQWINEEVVTNFNQHMQEAGKDLTYKIFNAHHAFANPSKDIFDADAANEANAMAIEFLKKSFELEE